MTERVTIALTEDPEIKVNFSADEQTLSSSEETIKVSPKDHSKLNNLDFEHSGHTGFASAKEVNELKLKTFVEIGTKENNKPSTNLIVGGLFYKLKE